MQFKNIFTGFLVLMSISILAETSPIERKKDKNSISSDSLKICIDYLKKYIQENEIWKTDQPEVIRNVSGLIHFAEDEHIDSILFDLQNFQKNQDFKYINRSPLMVKDTLKIPGYLSQKTISEKMKQLDRAIWKGVNLSTIPLPENLKRQASDKKAVIVKGDEAAIFEKTGIVLPDSLNNLKEIPDSLMKTSKDFNRLRDCDLLRTKLLEEARIEYNKGINKADLDSAIHAYRKYAVEIYSDSLQTQLNDSLKQQNQQLLITYNDSIVRAVNDSINHYVRTLQRYAENDSVSITIQSLSGTPSQIWLQNNRRAINRMYIKNVQNDSIGIQLMNIDKHNLGIAIEDNVTFNRIAQKQRRDFVFDKLTPDAKLTQMQKKYTIVSPWEIGGNGTFGVTQTYLNNWKAGGRSAFSFLMVLKGYANYSDHEIKWENSGELRNGWIRQGGDVDQTQKNDDKLELVSRLGVSAFKKWYYSTEIDFVTQFFNGYNYPDKTTPISAYLSPAKTMFKLGMDYKPNKNFSLFISPITAKTVFVRDTVKIDQTKYGIAADRRSFWEPGLNAEVRYKINLNRQVSVETKYKMFMNYQNPFRKFDINWENTLVAQLTDRISMTMMLYLLYDDNITFPTGKFNPDGKEIYKPKWQTKELMTIGFSYKINKHIYERRMAR